MNNPNTKPREWWIDDILNVDRPHTKTAYIYEQDTEKFRGKAVHVIEHSAYQALEQQLSCAKEKLLLQDRLFEKSIVVPTEEYGELLKKLKEAREVIEIADKILHNPVYSSHMALAHWTKGTEYLEKYRE